jgi:hypothetical protein
MTAPAVQKPKPSAATIRQINAAHDAVINAARDALQNAFRAGELLCAVKDGQDHGDWETWLSNNCANISPRTARLYMNLSRKEDALMAAAEQNGNTVADLSVREAQKLLAKPLTPEQKAERQAAKDKKKAEEEAAKKKAGTASPDLKDLLENSGVDEIGIALHDAEKLEDVAKASIVKLTPDKACDVLTQAWSFEEIVNLHNLLARYLNEQEAKGKAGSNRRLVEQPSP